MRYGVQLAGQSGEGESWWRGRKRPRSIAIHQSHSPSPRGVLDGVRGLGAWELKSAASCGALGTARPTNPFLDLRVKPLRPRGPTQL